MFAYIEQDSFLHRRNPMIKLLLIVVMTVGRTEKRTYYKTTEVTKSDWLFLVIGVIIYIIIVMILVKYDLFKLNFASIK